MRTFFVLALVSVSAFGSQPFESRPFLQDIELPEIPLKQIDAGLTPFQAIPEETQALAEAIREVVFDGKEPQDLDLLDVAIQLRKNGVDAGIGLGRIAEKADLFNDKMNGILQNADQYRALGMTDFDARRLRWAFDAANGIKGGRPLKALEAPNLAPPSDKIKTKEVAQQDADVVRTTFFKMIGGKEEEPKEEKLVENDQRRVDLLKIAQELFSQPHFHKNAQLFHYSEKRKLLDLLEIKEELEHLKNLRSTFKKLRSKTLPNKKEYYRLMKDLERYYQTPEKFKNLESLELIPGFEELFEESGSNLYDLLPYKY